mgnify:FL=1|jgi:hypothetical protein|tara:strand:+ start:1376 stop:1564 length:189 start_codon:yes stop_codon:yes gene_type:complete
MPNTIEENERAAYAAGNTVLSDAFSRIIDLEQERLRLRQLVREAVDHVQDKDWQAQADKELE